MPWLLAEDPTSHDLRFVGPKVPVRMGAGTPESMARELFLKYAKELHGTGHPKELGSAEIVPGEVVTVRFAQKLPDTEIPVLGATSTAHFTAQGELLVAEPLFFSDLGGVPKAAAVTPATALSLARAYLDETCGGSAADVKLTADLVVDVGRGPPHLEYRIADPTLSDNCLAPIVRVDATTAKLLGHDESVRHAESTAGTGVRRDLFGETNDTKIVGYTKKGNLLELGNDKVDIRQENPVPGALPALLPIAETSAEAWDTHIRYPGGRGSAVDAALHVEEALAFYAKPPFNHVGLSKDGSKTRVVVHDTHNDKTSGDNRYGAMFVPPGAAGFNYTDAIYVGDGSKAHGLGERASFAAGLDVMAHEVTHGVVHRTVGLDSRLVWTQAVEEAFCDIMGAAVEHERRPNEPSGWWVTGERTSRTRAPIRSLSAPSSIPGANGLDYY